MKNFKKFMVVILTLVITTSMTGFTFLKLWHWFIVPVFGMNELKFIEAIGLMLFISFIKMSYQPKLEQEDFWEDFFKRVVFVVILSSFVFVSGWILSLLIN